MDDGMAVLIVGAVLAATLGASMVADRLRMPALILFLGVGMAFGAEGFGGVRFTDSTVARDIGVLSLSLILFEGGLAASFARLRPVLRPALGLAIAGTIVTAVVTALWAMPLLHLGLLEALLLGSILASTDGAAVFAVLRSSSLPQRLVATLEGEAGLNDPVAVLLVLGFLHWITDPGWGLGDMVGLFVLELGLGAVCGLAVGRVAAFALARVRLPAVGLHPVGSTAAAAMAFGLATALGGSGFLAVYLAGLSLGSADLPAREPIADFHRAAGWLAQITLFVCLGLLVLPSRLAAVVVPGTILALVLMFLSRPIAVAIATAGSSLSKHERMVLGWAGLRGGVPVVLATYPLIAGVPDSLRFFDVAFYVVLLSTLVQGMTFEAVARLLGLVEEPVVAAVAVPAAAVAVAVDDVETVPWPVVATAVAAPAVAEAETAAVATVEAPPAPDPAPLEPKLWGPELGDATHPVILDRSPVVEHLRVRKDAPGALVRLADGRLAVTGNTLVVGQGQMLTEYAQQRAHLARHYDDRHWWTEVAHALRALF